MNTKKIIAMIIALIMTTATFAGCGNNTVDHKDTEVSSTVETNIDKTVEEKSEDKKSETTEKANATETADKKDSKETSKKTEKPNDNKVADKSDKDKDSANSSVSKPSNSGNANNNGSASKPSTPAKPDKPSGNSNSGSSNNGNHNGSVNKPSKPVEKPVEKPSEPSKPVEKPVEKPSEPQKPAPHVCNFNIWKDEVSHTEMVTETYTEQVPKYKWVSYDECRKCGFQSSDPDTMDMHCMECGGTYTTKKKQVQDGFETVTKTRQVPKTVVDDPAHYECSCGKRK